MGTLKHDTAVLEIHLENLRAAETFEDFKKVQVSYVEYLVKSLQAKGEIAKAADDYVETVFKYVATWQVAESVEAAPKEE